MSRRQSPHEPRPLRSGGASSVDERAAAKLLESHSVPAPDDLTRERVWQRIASPVRTRRAVRLSQLREFLLPGLALCSSLALLFFVVEGHAPRSARSASPRAVAVIAPPSAAELAAVRGGVFFSRPAERWQPGKEGQPLAAGQSVRTDPSGRAVLDVFGATAGAIAGATVGATPGATSTAGLGVASVLVGRDTDVAIERLGTGTFLRLSRGSIVARVSKRPAGEPFVVLTHGFSVKVVGTLFQVDQDAGDRTTVAVREGVVEVTDAAGGSWRIRAGQSWSSTSPEQNGASAIADPVKILLEDGLRRASVVDLDRELGAVDGTAPVEPLPSVIALAPVAAPATLGAGGGRSGGAEFGAIANLNGSASSRSVAARRAEVGPGGERSVAPLPPPPLLLATREPVIEQQSTHGSDSIPAPAPVAASAVSATAAPGAAPVAGTYGEGLALERAGRLTDAAADFAQAARGDPAHADLALYALGRLRQHRLRDPRGALEAFETYRHGYPGGALLPEVDLAVLEVEVATGQRKQALAESVRFLANHPGSERTDEVRLLRGNLLRDGSDCRAALGEYRQVRVQAFADEAVYETAYCQRKLGDVAGARESLRAYRTRFPDGPHRDEVAKELRE